MAGQLRGVAQFLSRARVPESSAGGDAYEAEDVVARAMESKRLGRHGRALELFLRGIAQNPREAELFVEVADVQLSRGELEATARAAESAIRLTPSLERAYVLNGHALLGLRRWTQAKTALERGLRHNPTSTTLAAMLAKAKKHHEADAGQGKRHRRSAGATEVEHRFLEDLRARYFRLLHQGEVGDGGAPIPAFLSLPPALPVSRHQLEHLYTEKGAHSQTGGDASAQEAAPSVYEQEVTRVVGIAVRMLDTIEPEAGGRSTVVFDVDDTALSSQGAMAHQRYAHVLKVSQNWCTRQEGRQIPQVLSLFRYAKHRGFYCVFLSGRSEGVRRETIDNLEAEGFTGFHSLVLRQDGDEMTATSRFKAAARSRLTDAGHIIVMTVGDQDSDLEGDAAHVGFAVKLPNYMYIID